MTISYDQTFKFRIVHDPAVNVLNTYTLRWDHILNNAQPSNEYYEVVIVGPAAPDTGVIQKQLTGSGAHWAGMSYTSKALSRIQWITPPPAITVCQIHEEDAFSVALPP